MHIDLLPEYQGQGWGRKMIEQFVERVQEAVREGQGLDLGQGIHIGAAAENHKVVPFYEKCGFRVQEGGGAEDSIWMVRDVDPQRSEE